ncbi:MAG TPA: ABC transporter ATP-binding protein [Polyangiaceae bacterium]|jgi:ABC-2 type transport system ATP-binding protein
MIEVVDLCKYYGDRRAAGPLSFTIERGEIVGLLGLNGAGKTTALRILACDLLPSSGTVRVDGLDVVEDPHEVRRRIGYLPETPPLYGEMTVHEYLVFAARLRGVAGSQASRAADGVEESLQLTAVRDDVISSLSLGFRQRVGIAQAVVHKPALLILDEPITGLDPAQIIEMRQLLRELRSEHTIVLSSHILTEISETCDRILVLREGEIVAAGKEADISRRMLGGVQIEVTVRVGPAATVESVRALLAGTPGATGVTAIAARETGPDIASFCVDADRDVRETVSRALVDAGAGILEIVRSRRELESVFLRLTGADPGAHLLPSAGIASGAGVPS